MLWYSPSPSYWITPISFSCHYWGRALECAMWRSLPGSLEVQSYFFSYIVGQVRNLMRMIKSNIYWEIALVGKMLLWCIVVHLHQLGTAFRRSGFLVIFKKCKDFHSAVIIISPLVKFLFSFLLHSVGECPNCLLVIVANPSYFAFSTFLI